MELIESKKKSAVTVKNKNKKCVGPIKLDRGRVSAGHNKHGEKAACSLVESLYRDVEQLGWMCAVHISDLSLLIFNNKT